MTDIFRSGFVSIIGRPNVGKSTFLNAVMETKISITASKPQTTRDRILGIWNSDDAQIIFLDTPGIHTPEKALNRYMVDKAVSTIADADIILAMIEPSDTPDTVSEIMALVRGSGKDAVLVLNKADLIRPDDADARLERFSAVNDFRHKQAVSSLNGNGIAELVSCLKQMLPEGPKFFPDDILTDAPVRFLCRELIREKVFTLTQREIPYATAVEIEEFREGEGEPTYIRAVIHVERPSQKRIVIGAGGSMLKAIGREARMDIQQLLETRVYLELFVKVTKDWSKKPGSLKELGYK